MPITNTWSVSQLECYPEYAGRTDVVFVCHWRMDGTDGEYAAGVYGSVSLTPNPEATFTPFASLTEAQVIGWVQDALGEEQVARYEADVAARIDDLVNPPVVTPPLPWAG